MIIAEKIEIGRNIVGSGGFADIKSGTYAGHAVAVKTLKIAVLDDIHKARSVSTNHIAPGSLRMDSTISRNFARKLCSGTRSPTQTS